jgi:hypothetical protein
MAKLAVLTYGIFHNALDDSGLSTFYDRGPAIFQNADRLPGFIKLVADKKDRDEPHSTFLSESDTIGSSETLSLWTNLETLFAFAYHGLHAEALNKRSQWFRKESFPAYAIWWVDDDHIPDWIEAYQRHGHLHKHGATAFAFDFKHPFDTVGNPVEVDRGAAKSIAQSLSH